MIFPSKQSPIGGLDVDSDELRIAANRIPFKKNFTFAVNKNAGAPGGEGSNFGVNTPLTGSKIMASPTTPFPSGVNSCIGSYESKETNKLYVFVHNSASNHFIYRINGDDGSVQMVYMRKHLKFKLDPRFFITEGRCVLRVVPYIDKATGLTVERSLLIFTNNDTDIRCISTEDSIATSSFDESLFPYFTPIAVLNADDAREEYISLGIATPNDCIGITPVARSASDLNVQNSLLYKGWEWRIKTVDIFGRESEHGIISERWFAIIGGSCLANSSGFSRCVELSIYAGNPFVNKIIIEFRNCTGNNKNLSNDSPWFEYDTIDKYNDCGTAPWYQRTISNPYQAALDALPGSATDQEKAEATNGLMRYNPATNRFSYVFCGDKLCNATDPAETSRLQNPMPLKSSSLIALDKGIALGNNVRGFEPLNCDQLKKISFSLQNPSEDECAYELRRIVVYAVIYNRIRNVVARTVKIATPGAVPGFAETATNFPTSCFGVSNCNTDLTKGKGQFIYGNQEGFIGYLAGTQYSVVSKQVVFDQATGTECDAGLWEQGGTNGCDGSPGIYMQKWEFLVPPGRYIFRVAGHRTNPATDYQKTSTLVRGIFQMASPTVTMLSPSKELVVNCCNGDFIANTPVSEILHISDFSMTADLNYAITTNEGYLYEAEKSKVPIELNPVVRYLNSGAGPDNLGETTLTDHNGFWFGEVRVRYGPTPITPPFPSLDNYTIYLQGTYCTGDYNLEVLNPANSKVLIGVLYMGAYEVYVKQGNDVFPVAGRRLVKGTIGLCDNHDIGISGIPVVLSDTVPGITALSGEFTIIAHNRYTLVQPGSSTNGYATDISSYTDLLYYSQGGCQLATCEDPCFYCLSVKSVSYKRCGVVPDRNLVLPAVYLNVRGINIAGPQHGGRYGLGIMMWDWMGRVSFVQADETWFLDVPNVFDTKTFDYSKIRWAIDPSIIFPSRIKRISFCITDNLNWDDFLTWRVDRVDKIDAAGNVNSAAPTKLRIYYESLLEYSKQNNYSVNTAWQFIVPDTTVEQSVVGDLVQFTKNGDNTYFNNSIQYQVLYDSAGKYFQVDYDPTLGEVLPGAIYKLIRPKTCLTNNLYYELCPSIGVVNGVPQLLSGELKFMDSYMLLRLVPVPVYSENPDDVNNPIKAIETVQIPFYMEHHSPSDFWGDHCATRGRVNVQNKYEKQTQNGSEIALSKSFINKGVFNGLSYFDTADIASFDEMKWGNITLIFPEINTLLVLCDNGNFLVGYNDNNVRTNADGQVIAPSSLGKFGTPQRNPGTGWGLLPEDVATARKVDKLVVFLDGFTSQLVFHGYSDAKAVSMDGYASWVNGKISYRNTANNSNSNLYTYHFVAGIDANTQEYLLTSRRFRKNGALLPLSEYVNQQRGISIEANETAIIDLETGVLKSFASFTPEYYGTIEGYFADKNMVSMYHGGSWHHHGEDPLTVPYNNFFAVQCKKIVEVITNISSEKLKGYLWNEVYCQEHLFEADRVVTESGQTSLIPASWWEDRGTFYAAPFLCATNTPPDPNLVKETGVNALLDGNTLSGRWVKVRYVSRDADDGAYCEVSAICAYVMAVDKSAD